jgi:integrase
VVSFPLRAKVTAQQGVRDKSDSLTELRIEKLKATGTEYYVQDGRQPGLSVRVSAQGVRAFVFTKKKDGRLTRITIGRSPAMRLDDARRAVQRLNGDMAMGVDVRAERKAERDAAKQRVVTMDDAFEQFLRAKERRESTVTDYRCLWRMHAPASLKRRAVAEVTTGDIKSAMQALGTKRRTANKLVVLLGAVLSKAGRRADNPARDIERHQEHVRTRRLSPDELRRVWSALGQEQGWGDFFRLLILTGARRGAFCRMRWGNIDLEAGVWLVPAEWSKSKREMAIPLTMDAVRILRARRGHVEGEWVWPATRGRRVTGHVVNPEKPWRRVLKAAGVLEHTTLHDVRRTLGSRLAMGNVAGETISAVLGHVSPQSRKAYTHLDAGAGREAIERVMGGIAGGQANGR